MNDPRWETEDELTYAALVRAVADERHPHRTYRVCDECAQGLTNGDWSFVDGLHADADECAADVAARMASVESMGNVAPTGQTARGYRLCFVCDADAIDCQIWETVR